MRLPEPPILCVTDRRQARKPLPEIAATLFAAGCRWLSVRETDLPDGDVARIVADIRAVAPDGACLTTHGSAKVATATRADGVHLPSSADAGETRRILGARALIGQSVHSPQDARAADPVSVDYLVAGPAFPTASKPGYGPTLGRDSLAAIVDVSPVPVIAIGGIDPGNLEGCLDGGCAGIAVMGGLMRPEDPGATFAALRTALDSAR